MKGKGVLFALSDGVVKRCWPDGVIDCVCERERARERAREREGEGV